MTALQSPKGVRETLIERDVDGSELARVHQATGIVSWVWDLPSATLRWTGDLSPLIGLPAGTYRGSFDEFQAALHPEDRHPSLERLRACLRGALQSYQVEERIVLPDGRTRWLETCGHVPMGADGRAARLAGVVRDVTDRRDAQQALEANLLRLRRLVDDAPVAIGMSREGQVVQGNDAFRRLFGIGSEARLAELRVLDLVAPASRAEFQRRTQDRSQGKPVEAVYELQLCRLDGVEFSGLVSVSEAMLADGPADAVFVQDLTDARRHRQALQFERDRSAQYLQIARSILLELDERGRIAVINERGQELLGYAAAELVGRDWFETFRPPEEVEAARALYAEVMDGRLPPIEHHESRVRTQQGEVRLIAWRNGLLRDEQGRVRGLLSSGEDITIRRQADEDMRELARSLEQRVQLRTAELEASNRALALARDAAEAGTRAKGEFLAHMSHEIRTPMNAVIGMTHLALQLDGLPAKARNYLSQIDRAAGSLLVIINDVLDFSRIESGHLELVHESFELAEVLERVVALVAQSAADKGLRFGLDVAAGLPPCWLGDAQRIGQVLLNLCGNAVKFTAQGEVVLGVAPVNAAGGAGGGLRFAVRDTGIGISAEQCARLFQPFEQLDASITRRFGGTGLGLAISRQLVERMGGAMEVSSQPGVGSEFRFTLPLAVSAVAPAARGIGVALQAAGSEVGHRQPSVRAALAGRRLLLVEDNELNRIVAHDLLCEHAGAAVDMAGNGHEALQRLEQGTYDVVLMDLQMPDMDGLEATRRIRAQARLATLPVIAMTAHALARDRELCLSVGMNDFVTKPFEAGELLAVLQRWMPTAAPAAEAGALDITLGLRRCLDRPDLYQRVLQRFVATREVDAVDLHRALHEGRLGAARHLAHSLISTAATIGADALSATARELQLAIDEGHSDEWPRLDERLQALHRSALAEARLHLQRSGDLAS